MPSLKRLLQAGACGLALATALGSAPPARAQSLDDLKKQLMQMQRRIDQLEAAQRRSQAAEAPAGRAPRSQTAQVRAAQKAAEDAQAAAVQAQQAAAAAQQQAAQAKEQAAAEVKAAYAPPPGKPAGSFRIPGTDTTVRLYGFAKANLFGDATTTDRNDTLTAQSIQLFNSPAQRQGGDVQFSARRSRIGFETFTPVNDTFGEFHTQVEMDFAGQNTSLTTQATSNSYTPRLRKAYGEFGNAVGGWGSLLFGQTDTLYSDTAILPIQWMSDWTYVAIDNVRQAQFRYTYGFGDGLSASFAVESPYSDVTTTAGVSYPDSNGGGGVGFSQVPDFTGRLMWKAPWATAALRGVVRPEVSLNNQGATVVASRFNSTTTGWGVGPTGVINLLDGSLVLMASGNVGNGIGRYLDATSNGYGAMSNFGMPGVTGANVSIDAPLVYAGMVGAQYFFTPSLRTNMSIGGARIINPSYADQFGGCVGSALTAGSCNTVNKSEWAGAINLVWSPFKAVDIGLEYQHVERTLQARNAIGPGAATTSGGIANRIQLTMIGRF
jgi:hypothetical protein